MLSTKYCIWIYVYVLHKCTFYLLTLTIFYQSICILHSFGDRASPLTLWTNGSCVAKMDSNKILFSVLHTNTHTPTQFQSICISCEMATISHIHTHTLAKESLKCNKELLESNRKTYFFSSIFRIDCTFYLTKCVI